MEVVMISDYRIAPLRRVFVYVAALCLPATPLILLLPGTPARAQTACDTAQDPTFTVHLPVLDYPPDEEGQGWPRPKVWDGHESATNDSIVVPNGRPIYALIISGYSSNQHLDELMLYDFARHLQASGAYVHWAWWNNLLAPYMERPLHHPQSEPGDLGTHSPDFINMTAEDAGRKAVPSEDYQLVADAKRFIAAIREHNPGAIVIVAGHSMGGGATVHIGSGTGELIDILAPIDPVGNRNYPFAGNERVLADDFNWTRWRISRDSFRGYKQSDWDRDQGQCVPTGPWLYYSPNIGSSDIRCLAVMFVDQPPVVAFGSNIVNLYYRYQREFLFPFDYEHVYHFGHNVPANGISSQAEVPMGPEFCGFLNRCDDPGGWPAGGSTDNACCETGDGVGWPKDGHGEIVGYRGPLPDPVPLGVRIRTSPECGSGCTNLIWPERYKDEDNDVWVNGDGALRKQLLTDLESVPEGTAWTHRPTNPALCLVSPGLIDMFNTINKPPNAQAGPDQVVECTGRDGTEVILDGSASGDPDGDALTYQWTWADGSAAGEAATATFPLGRHCVTLTVRDPSGHTDEDIVIIEVADTTPPELTVEVHPNSLWPPNHKMAEIQADVHAEDLCGDVASLTLVSVVSSEPDNDRGDGNTTDDIQGTEINTLDTLFAIRSEWRGGGDGRRYTVTYQATDDSGNRAEMSKDIVVRNNPPGRLGKDPLYDVNAPKRVLAKVRKGGL
jgi:pimeloyl-ACP methyl ester carboxylesterase